MHYALGIGLKFDAAGLQFLDGLGHIESDGAAFGVGHEAFGAQGLAQLGGVLHHIGSDDKDVEIHEAAEYFLYQLGSAVNVRAGGLGFFFLLALGYHGDLLGLAGPVRQADGAAHLLV